MGDVPIPLGCIAVDPAGYKWTVGGVTNMGGERYYLLTHRDKSVSLMPAFIVEDWNIFPPPAKERV